MAEILNEQEQQLLLEYILNDRKLFITVLPVLKPEYFGEPLNRVVEFVSEYFMEHHAIADLDIIKAKFGIVFHTRETATDEFDYAVKEMETHCKLAAVRNAFEKGIEKFHKGEIGALANDFEKANAVSIHKSLGTQQFKDVAMRLTGMQLRIDTRSSGWLKLDGMIDGIRRGELFLVAAGTMGGKSIFLANIANNLARQKLNGIIISLELNEELISKRLDSIITGIESKTIFENIDKVVAALALDETTYGDIIIKKLPSGSTANDIRSYVMEYHLQKGFYPDFICVDYLDLMKPIEKQSKDGAFERDKAITEELRDVFVDFNVYGFSASQLNRDSVNSTVVTHAHIAGGLSKLNTCDTAIAIIAPSDEEVDSGERTIQQLKIRNAERQPMPFTMFLNSKNLRMSDTPSLTRTASATNVFQDPSRVNSIKDKLRESVTKNGKKEDAS